MSSASAPAGLGRGRGQVAPAAAAPVPRPIPPPAYTRLADRHIAALNVTIVLRHIYRWAPPLARPSSFGSARAPPGTPRGSWDRHPPAAIAVEHWAQGPFVHLPGSAYFGTPEERQEEPVVVPGLPPWRGSQPLSSRERAWVREPVLRSVDVVGLSNPDQLAVRAQLREGILVTRAGRQPPDGQECTECRDANTSKPFANCISGGIGQKCNNCLYRGHAQCSLRQ